MLSVHPLTPFIVTLIPAAIGVLVNWLFQSVNGGAVAATMLARYRRRRGPRRGRDDGTG
jgi:hypothetical protein